MYEIFVERDFAAAHYLRNYPGNCEHLHGHNWIVKVFVQTDSLNDIHVGIDFRDLKKAVDAVLEGLDHTNINEHPAFQERNPSSENIARFIFEELKGRLSGYEGVRLSKVMVCETPKTGVLYRE